MVVVAEPLRLGRNGRFMSWKTLLTILEWENPDCNVEPAPELAPEPARPMTPLQRRRIHFDTVRLASWRSKRDYNRTRTIERDRRRSEERAERRKAAQ